MPKLFAPAASLLLALPLSVSQALGQAPALPDSAAAALAPAPAQTIFKLGLDAADAWGSWFGFQVPVYAGVERQLGRNFALSGDVRQGFGVSQGRLQLAEIRASLGVRYYYGQARRQRLGKPIAPFNGTYLQLQISNNLTRAGSPYWSDRPVCFNYQPSAELMWGWQRTFGKYGFFDAGAGLRLQRQSYYTLPGWSRNLQLEPYIRLRTGVRF
ncbi:hypothetical protein [Hymenobacter latericus]|uniref:hypothetical protein n=1 Tax=Hymenobacter sp. YIM 151858-1 TaxID=2987688 RepID=UPI00222619EF|nr:hypothetical protein [Hymenobacter sp. YIM 151858-1]UYZ58580.1 hypothetical protein OIS50_16150 [Hymenobacter sp. YIM 151858-1]